MNEKIESNIFYEIKIIDDSSPECIICMESINNTSIIKLPINNVSNCKCKGDYHSKCLYEWFIIKKKIICPICMMGLNKINFQIIDNNYYNFSNNITNNDNYPLNDNYNNNPNCSKCYIILSTSVVSLIVSFIIYIHII
jgi:hypothetical protein